jgi:hypothetical protein
MFAVRILADSNPPRILKAVFISIKRPRTLTFMLDWLPSLIRFFPVHFFFAVTDTNDHVEWLTKQKYRFIPHYNK